MGQLENMNNFVRIVEAGSISQAATQMNIVKSAVSRRLVELESKLGVQLINRTTRKSHLTEAGQNYYNKCVKILSEIEELNAKTAGNETELSGKIKISAPHSFGIHHLSPALNEFSKQHPQLSVEVDFNDKRVDLIEEGYDIAIRISQLKSSSLMAKKLAPVNVALCASPAYLAKNGTPKTATDLKNHDILHYNISDNRVWNFKEPDGSQTNLNLNYKIVANNGEFLKDAAKDDLGICFLPTFISWKELKSGALKPILCQYEFPNINAYAIYPNTRYLPNKTRVLINFLQTTFGAQPYWNAPY